MKIGKTLTQQVSEYADKVHAKREKAQEREYNKKVATEQQLESSWKLPDEVISTKVVRGQLTVEEEQAEEIQTKEVIYWKYIKEDDSGNVYIKVYGSSEQERIKAIIESSRLEDIARRNRIRNGLAHSTLKAELINELIADDKRTRVIPEKSTLFGNNIQVIPERHAIEITKGERSTTRTKGTFVKQEKVILRGSM